MDLLEAGDLQTNHFKKKGTFLKVGTFSRTFNQIKSNQVYLLIYTFTIQNISDTHVFIYMRRSAREGLEDYRAGRPSTLLWTFLMNHFSM